jgi:hypothetical protein
MINNSLQQLDASGQSCDRFKIAVGKVHNVVDGVGLSAGNIDIAREQLGLLFAEIDGENYNGLEASKAGLLEQIQIISGALEQIKNLRFG